MTKRYVVGFVIDFVHESVLLTLKNFGWQKGFWNGIGGKVEENEESRDAIIREGKEKIDLILPWVDVGLMHGTNNDRTDFYCTIFVCFVISKLERDSLPSCTDVGEVLSWYPLKSIPKNVIPNLTWIIPYIMDFGSNGHSPKYLDVGY